VLKGNVGIGTTNPTKKLDVNGDIRSTNIEIGGDVFFKGLTRSTKNDVVFFDENDGKLYYDSGESIGTDDQTLAIDSLNRVFDISLENGNTVSFQDTFTDADADATNELQSISGSGFDLSTNDLTIGIEDGLNETVNLSALDNSGTDDQSISGSGFNTLTNDLTIGIENGLNETVDLSALDNSGSWTWNGYSIDNSTSINTLGGNGLTVNTFSETSNSVTTEYELGTPSTITGSTTNGTTSSSHTHALDFAIDDATDTDIEGQSGPPLAIGQILKWDGQNWINDNGSYIGVNDMILSDHTYTAQNTYQAIYETDITASRESGTTYEINIVGEWEFDGNADVEINWVNLDQAAFATIASFNLIGGSNIDVMFDAKIKVTLRNGDDGSGYNTYTYLDWKDQTGNGWMYKQHNSVNSDLSGAGETIELRVKVRQVDGYIAVEQGETKILK
jgi:hypothetical protein